MKALVEYIAKSLVDEPDEVSVREVVNQQSVVLQLKVAPGDMGKIIGKQGRVAKSMRALLKVAAARERKRVVLEIG